MKEHQANSTALLIAASLSFLSRQDETESLVSREARAVGDWLLRHYSSFTRVALACLPYAWFRGLVHGLETVTIPHMVQHYAVRKHAIECLVRQSVPTAQLVVLGAGFDTLSARLVAEFPDLGACEIDHPATQAWKTKVVAACNLASPRLTFVPLDLASTLAMGIELLGPQYRPEQEACWVAEGFLMYFSAGRVKEFFAFIRQVSPSGSRVVFTFMEPQDDGRVDFRQPSRGVRLWLAHRREPFAWGIRRDELAACLSSLGFTLLEIAPEITPEVARLNVGEYLALAEVQ